jgi:hypothetical protein
VFGRDTITDRDIAVAANDVPRDKTVGRGGTVPAPSKPVTQLPLSADVFRPKNQVPPTHTDSGRPAIRLDAKTTGPVATFTCLRALSRMTLVPCPDRGMGARVALQVVAGWVVRVGLGRVRRLDRAESRS